jgi:hypothetical protein
MIILKKMSVYIIYLLALSKNIIDVAKLTSFIYFNHTIVTIYSNSFFDILPIIFE